MEILFGPDIAIGNIHYGILFTNWYSCMTYLYPLQNLTSDIGKQTGFTGFIQNVWPCRCLS
jgi:hypothetical protein